MKHKHEALASEAATAAHRPLLRWFKEAAENWNRFWFTPRPAHALSVIRIACGSMLVYIHIVWASQLTAFLGPDAWINNETIREFHASGFGWSYLWYIDNEALLWSHHAVTLVVCALMAIGLASRVTVPLAWFLNLMYCHRLTGALFGLDQIVMLLAMYCMLAPSGTHYSVDAWLRSRGKNFWWIPSPAPSMTANLATRLIQIHLCIVYLFGGLSKLRGELWFDGSALWYAAVNYEYQSLDITWIGRYPMIVALLTHVTLFWETFYCALIWPRQTRPIMLALAVLVHGGIALALGMITFGTMMLVANLAFVSPATIKAILSRCQEFFSSNKRVKTKGTEIDRKNVHRAKSAT